MCVYETVDTLGNETPDWYLHNVFKIQLLNKFDLFSLMTLPHGIYLYLYFWNEFSNQIL